jgi:isoquinoline 1-oxidoreductase subunit beta
MSALLDTEPGVLDRRSFLKATAVAGGGFLLGTYFRFGMSDALAQFGGPAAPLDPSAFINIAPTGGVAIMAKNPEMGQGIKTSLPMIIAEELDVPWSSVTVYQADLNAAYGRQMAVGSQSTPGNYEPMRRLGAAARAMLIQAGAQKWNVPSGECTTDGGVVVHAASNRRAPYGDLAAAAALLPVPDDATLTFKDPKDYKILGKRIPGVDNAKVVTGAPLFGLDVKLPDMIYATYTKCPVNGGKVVSANLDEVKKLPGVIDAYVPDDVAGLAPGVAIVANSTWNAISASKKLKVQWDAGGYDTQNSDDFAKQAAALAPGGTDENPAPAGGQSLAAAYHYPYLAHATMEPQNCTALFKNGTMEMWCPTQIPSSGQGLVTRGLGLSADQVVVHVTRLGGGFGRRGSNEYSLEVAAIAQKFEGRPVKLTWTREQDIAHDNFRAGGWHFFQGTVDAAGKLASWRDHFITFGLNNTSRAGTASDMNAGDFPNGFIADFRVNKSFISSNVPMGFWRAPGDNAHVWAVQSFLDELAHAAARDPYQLRLDLLAQTTGRAAFTPARMTAVVRRAADKGQWGQKLPRGQGQGIAFAFSHSGYVAVVAQVTVSQKGELQVNRLTAATDVGPIINLSAAENQVQGAMLDGLGAAWFLKITIDKGAAAQSNFDEYPLMRLADAPPVVGAHFIESAVEPTGLGEPALPPVIPAVCNAIFAATGKRIRTLPISDQDLTWS